MSVGDQIVDVVCCGYPRYLDVVVEDAGDALRVWEREIERIFRLYQVSSVKSSEYKKIDESVRYLDG